MFEALGVCRESAKKMRDDVIKARAETRSNVGDETYLDTKEVIPRNTLKRREPWRERIKHQTLDEYKKELSIEVLDAQEWRRQQLLRMYPCATFETLDGRRWQATALRNFERNRKPFKPMTSPYPLLKTAPIAQAKRMSSWELFNSFCDLSGESETGKCLA
jgi:hypothetical protein